MSDSKSSISQLQTPSHGIKLSQGAPQQANFITGGQMNASNSGNNVGGAAVGGGQSRNERRLLTVQTNQIPQYNSVPVVANF